MGSWIELKKESHSNQAERYPAQVKGTTELLIHSDMDLKEGPINWVDMVFPLGSHLETAQRNDPSVGEIMSPPSHCPSQPHESPSTKYSNLDI